MKSSARISAELYQALAASAIQKFPSGVAAAHKTLFKPDKAMWLSLKDLYLDQIPSYKRGEPVKRRPGGEMCTYCAQFHLGNLKNIDKDSDIKLGQVLESCFLDFFNTELKKRELELHCCRADCYDEKNPEYMHMPDFKVINKAGEDKFFIEFKAIFRPYLKISEKVRPDYECYSHSQTLDISNGKKLANQRRLVEEIGIEKVAYVYWYDLPCLKGIFWIPAQRVYELWDHGDTPRYARKIVDGDLNAHGYVRAAINKIYMPLLEMVDFNTLFEACHNP